MAHDLLMPCRRNILPSAVVLSLLFMVAVTLFDNGFRTWRLITSWPGT